MSSGADGTSGSSGRPTGTPSPDRGRSPRAEALIEIARGVRDLVRGREPRAAANARRADLAEVRWRLDRGRAALGRGDPEGAREDADAARRLRGGERGGAALDEAAGRSEPIRGRAGDRALGPDEIPDAVGHLHRLGHLAPTLLLYHQPSPDNPFQSLLYRRAWANGIAPVPLADLDDLGRIPAMVPAGTRLVLHLHWVNRVVGGATDERDAAARAAAFATRLDRALADGFRIVWTAHNVLPHDTAFEAADAQVRRAIVERAALIHLLAGATPELAAPWYRIPVERTIHVPLPSFRGAYADVVDRDAARYALRLPADAWVIALVGGLRPHKGLEHLLDALEIATRRDARLHLVVAGPPARSPATDAFLSRAAGNPQVTLHARFIPAEDLQLFLRAADVAVLPYLVTLNSAVLMTALAFDLPVIAPPVGSLSETIEPGVSVTFTPGDPASLAEAILASRDLPRDAVVAAARRISAARDPDALSDRLMAAILATGSGPAGGEPSG